MGVYLSSPVTEKVSSDNKCKKFVYGASSMQGWRMSQEDAHNCVPDFDEDTALFAVYDGHGGAEVAHYCAIHLPDYIKKIAVYKEGKLGDALEEAFLGFDELLREPSVIDELKVLAGVDEDDEDKKAGVVPASKKEADMLRAEADMPLEEVLAKYDEKTPGSSTQLLNVKNSCQPAQQFKSPMIKAKSNKVGEMRGGDNWPDMSKDSKECNNSSQADGDFVRQSLGSKLANGHADNENNMNIEKEISQSSFTLPAVSIVVEDESGNKISESIRGESSNDNNSSDAKQKTGEVLVVPASSTTGDNEMVTIVTDPVQYGSSSGGDTAAELSSSVPGGEDFGPSSSSRDDPQPAAGSSLGDGPEPTAGSSSVVPALGTVLDLDDSDDDDDDSDDYEEGEEEEDDLSEEDTGDEELEEDGEAGEDEFFNEEDPTSTRLKAMMSEERHEEEPGSDSGCTAVMALLQGRQLVVANAGDSRCVLCRGGRAVDLSFDHKPEDKPEKTRIEKAGGKVTVDGRVNGGLNLSRAIGDHFYKKNNSLPAKDQMITAFPDIQTTTLGQEDEFIVLACDGIWNYMNSQEVVDFISARLSDPAKRESPSKICEEVFDHCLAPNTMGDGTGCDNMTCILVLLDDQFRREGESVVASSEVTGVKRDASQLDSSAGEDEGVGPPTEKRQKIEIGAAIEANRIEQERVRRGSPDTTEGGDDYHKNRTADETVSMVTDETVSQTEKASKLAEQEVEEKQDRDGDQT